VSPGRRVVRSRQDWQRFRYWRREGGRILSGSNSGEYHAAPEAYVFAVTLLLHLGRPAGDGRLGPGPDHPQRDRSDGSLWPQNATDTSAKVDFLATKLHAQLLRFDVHWNRTRAAARQVRPDLPGPARQRLSTAAATDGLKVIVTLYGTPSWATDRTLWRYVPPGYKAGVSHSFYPPAPDRLDDFQAFATKLASTFGNDVTGLRVPQRAQPVAARCTRSARRRTRAFAVRRYAAMLTAFSKGIRAGDPHALVIAGATGPTVRTTTSCRPVHSASPGSSRPW
jgi:hypothetical protein